VAGVSSPFDPSLSPEAIASYRDSCSCPGKFEGEQPETVYYYSAMLNGDGEALEDLDEDAGVMSFTISPEEAAAFSIPEGGRFLLWESNEGFAYGRVD